MTKKTPEMKAKALDWLSMMQTSLYRQADWICDDDDCVLLKVKQNGLQVQHASDRLRDDETIGLAAIESDWMSLQYLSPRLQDTKGIVQAAMSINPYALTFASERLRSDVDLVFEGYASSRKVDILSQASPALFFSDRFVDRGILEGVDMMEMAKRNPLFAEYMCGYLQKNFEPTSTHVWNAGLDHHGRLEQDSAPLRTA